METFNAEEMRILRQLNTPAKIQDFINGMTYHLADTVFSPRKVLRERTAHCFEGALFAAATLRVHGYEPLIMDLEAVNDQDHVVAIYKQKGAWGAIGTSNFPGTRGRPAVYRTLRELAISYFNDYFNLRKQFTLRNYSKPVNLRRFDHRNWMTSEKNLWYIEEYLFDIPHFPLITKEMEESLPRLDDRAFEAGLYGKITRGRRI